MNFEINWLSPITRVKLAASQIPYGHLHVMLVTVCGYEQNPSRGVGGELGTQISGRTYIQTDREVQILLPTHNFVGDIKMSRLRQCNTAWLLIIRNISWFFYGIRTPETLPRMGQHLSYLADTHRVVDNKQDIPRWVKWLWWGVVVWFCDVITSCVLWHTTTIRVKIAPTVGS